MITLSWWKVVKTVKGGVQLAYKRGLFAGTVTIVGPAGFMGRHWYENMIDFLIDAMKTDGKQGSGTESNCNNTGAVNVVINGSNVVNGTVTGPIITATTTCKL